MNASRSQVARGAAIVAMTFIAYIPAMSAGWIWDDPQYVVNNHTLRDFEGLIEIWLHPRSLPQWYPLVHTSFWVEYQLFGLRPSAYHFTNIALHAFNALLVWRLLARLNVRGCWLAAAVFAVHPVMVESVAWVTERKNILSLFFYLLALRAYLFPAENKPALQGRVLAFAFFACALLSKSVTASLPAAILVILWWQRGKLRWRDFTPLIPFFLAGIAMASMTSWLEVHHVGADGSKIAEFRLSSLQRIFIAGRALWFYAAKLFWPTNLTFIYPRWPSIDQASPWLAIFPLALGGVIVALWLLRLRGALAAVLLYCGTLAPALGFVNVYPLRFSYVADHFQYHASVALIALVCAAIASIDARRWAVVLLLPLGILTFHQSRIYADAVTLWTDTLANNPNSWMVNTNLGNAYAERKDYDKAIPYHERALQLAPELYDTHWNVGVGLMRQNRVEEARAEFEKSIQMNPEFAPGYDSLGKIYMFRDDDLDRAEAMFVKALAIAPNWSDANYDYGVMLRKRGRIGDAIDRFRAAVTYDPDNIDAHFDLAALLLNMGQSDEAMSHFLDVIRLDATRADAWAFLGVGQLKSGQFNDAELSFTTALKLRPNYPPAVAGLAQVRSLKGQ